MHRQCCPAPWSRKSGSVRLLAPERPLAPDGAGRRRTLAPDVSWRRTAPDAGAVRLLAPDILKCFVFQCDGFLAQLVEPGAGQEPEQEPDRSRTLVPDVRLQCGSSPAPAVSRGAHAPC